MVPDKIFSALPDTATLQVHIEHLANMNCFLFYNDRLPVFSLRVSKQVIPEFISAGLHPLLYAPAHVRADIFALGLCHNGVHTKQQLVVRFQTVKILFLKEYAYAFCLELSYTFQRVNRIACKTRDRFRQYIVDSSPIAIPHHAIEIYALFRSRTGQTFIGINVYHLPLRIFSDCFRIIGNLSLITL